MTDGILLPNGGAVPLADVPALSVLELRRAVLHGVAKGGRLAALFGAPIHGALRLVAVLAWRERGMLSVASATVGDCYPALTPDCPQAHLFEREIAEQCGVTPEGHPWLKPVRFPAARTDSHDASRGAPVSGACGVMDFFRVDGEEIHEVAVGPVHAGIIEPGHFRFQCHGETVHHLEISLGYQHRGVERALVGCTPRRRMHYVETLAGDTTVGHALAHARALEALARCRVPARAQAIRGVALELERIANHVGDLGALAGDIGFLPTMSYCGRIRGDVLNLTAALCGNRFGRGLVRPGGVGYDAENPIPESIRQRLETALRDIESAVGLLWTTPSVLSRFEGTGVVSRDTAEQIGLVGVAARACGLNLDVRLDYPYGIYRLSHIPVSTWTSGDVFARALVRWQEIQRSAAFVQEQLEMLPQGPVRVEPAPMLPLHLAVSMVEAWRGEICHVLLTGDTGEPARCKVVDPSFHNWFGLACALRNQQISDFPLCNKSFNLSYCGHDL